MINEITDFNGLEKYTKESGLKFRDAIIRYYTEVGGRLGFTVRENPPIIVSGVNYGKLDLVWLEPNVSFSIEFGSLDDVYKHLWKILEFGPGMAVLILSSRAGCKAEDVARMIEKSKLAGDKDIFLILDISEKKVIRQPASRRS